MERMSIIFTGFLHCFIQVSRFHFLVIAIASLSTRRSMSSCGTQNFLLDVLVRVITHELYRTYIYASSNRHSHMIHDIINILILTKVRITMSIQLSSPCNMININKTKPIRH